MDITKLNVFISTCDSRIYIQQGDWQKPYRFNIERVCQGLLLL